MQGRKVAWKNTVLFGPNHFNRDLNFWYNFSYENFLWNFSDEKLYGILKLYLTNKIMLYKMLCLFSPYWFINLTTTHYDLLRFRRSNYHWIEFIGSSLKSLCARIWRLGLEYTVLYTEYYTQSHSSMYQHVCWSTFLTLKKILEPNEHLWTHKIFQIFRFLHNLFWTLPKITT